jgi:3-oxoacyl-[acyl-carrier-protein] synthase III
MPVASKIIGTGHYVPDKIVTNFDIMKMMDTSDEFIVSRTGIRERRHVEADVCVTDIAVPACRAAVADAGLNMEDIDCIIMNTITPDHNDPGCAFFLHAKLGVGNIPAIDIKEQCCGLLFGMTMADHFIRLGTFRHVLVVCAEVLSKRIDGSYDGRNISILFGDGAGAVVVGPSDDPAVGILSTVLHADGSMAKALFTEAPGTANNKMAFVDKDDIDAGRVYFRMDGKTIFENGVARMIEAVEEIFQRNHIGFDDIDMLIPHQPNLRMIETIIEKTGIDTKKIFVNVEKFGNMASACLPVALDQARKQGRIRKGDLVQLVAFGSGFVWAAILVRM